MSSVQEGFSFRQVTAYGIYHVTRNLLPIENRECMEIQGIDPEQFLYSQLGIANMREIIEDETGDIVGILGVEYADPGVIIPWIILRSDFKPPHNFIRFSRKFLQGLWKEGYDTMLALKLASNTQQIRVLELFGFSRNPDVVITGTQGGELHEYIIKRSNT